MKNQCENVKRVNDLIVISKNRKTTKFKNTYIILKTKKKKKQPK